MSLWHPVKQLFIWLFLLRKYTAHPALHVLPWIIFLFYHLLKKTASQRCPNSPGTDIHQHGPVFPLRCLSILVPLIKPHRFRFIKIMPRKPWILPEVHIQQNAKEEQKESTERVCKSGYLFLFKRPKNVKAWIRVLNKTHSWLIKTALPTLLYALIVQGSREVSDQDIRLGIS